jgi:hypothetical protein
MTLVGSNGHLPRRFMSTVPVNAGEVAELHEDGGAIIQGQDGIRYSIKEPHFHAPRQHGTHGELRRFAGRGANTHVFIAEGFHSEEGAAPIEEATPPKEKRSPFKAVSVDAEVRALAGVVELLDGLEPEAVGRVLDYSWGRYLKKPLPLQGQPRL